MNETQPKYCKKIVFNSGDQKPTVIYGVIISEDDFFITAKTEYKTHLIARNSIINISDTSFIFRGTIPQNKNKQETGVTE